MPMKELEQAVLNLLSDMKVNEITEDISLNENQNHPIYLDQTEKDNSKWLELLKKALKTAKTFEIHCWNGEEEWIELALQYGVLKESDWNYGKMVTGKVTPEFADMLLGLPKPQEIEFENKMTPFFNVFFDNGFQSSHYGTEIYIGEPGLVL